MDLECVEMETLDAVYGCKPDERSPLDPRMAVNKARMIDFDEWLYAQERPRNVRLCQMKCHT